MRPWLTLCSPELCITRPCRMGANEDDSPGEESSLEMHGGQPNKRTKASQLT